MDNNNNMYKDQITTSGVSIFDDTGNWLKLGYLDDALSLMICAPTIGDGGKRSYPQESRKPFIITLDRASAFNEEIIIKKVLPAIEKGEDYNGGIFLNKRKDAIFEIRIQSGEIYAAYHKDIGEDRSPKESYIFHFQKVPIVESYNPDGTSFEQSNTEGQFILFCKYVEAGVFDLHKSSAHASRKGNQYTISKIFDYLAGISAKLGVTVEKRTFQNAAQKPTSGFMNIPDGAGEENPFNESNIPEASSLADILS